MAMEAFDKELTALVDGGKLSGSRIKAITELALDNIKNDAHIASTLFRTHKRAKPGNKLWALYVLDAVARECRNRAKKQARTDRGGSHSPSVGAPADGTPAGFLVKTEMFLERMVDESKANGVPEHLEKVKKLIGIWQQAGTFAPALLARCHAKLTESASTTPPNSPPRQPYRLPSAPSSSAPPAPPVANGAGAAPAMPMGAQNALAALLASAQTPAGPVPGAPPTNQLGALLQQLAGQAQPLGQPQPQPSAQSPPYRREMASSPPRRRSRSPPMRAAPAVQALREADPNDPFEARFWIKHAAQSGARLPGLDEIHAWCLDGGLASLGVSRDAIVAAGAGAFAKATPQPAPSFAPSYGEPQGGGGGGGGGAAGTPGARGRMVQTSEGKWVFRAN